MSDYPARFHTARLRFLAGVAGAIVAAALALGLGLAPAVAEEPPAGEASEPFPPYPDVWGRELPYPGAGSCPIPGTAAIPSTRKCSRPRTAG